MATTHADALRARALKIGGKSFQTPGWIESQLCDELPR